MPSARMFADRVTLHRWTPTGTEDDRGNPVAGFMPATSPLPPAGGHLQPAFMAFRRGDGDAELWACALPGDVPKLDEKDRVSWGTRLFEVKKTLEGRRPGSTNHHEVELLEVG